MLDKIDLTKKLSKEEYNQLINGLSASLSSLQRDARNNDIPILIVFEGFGAAGKGTLINQLIQPLDPRGFLVYTTEKATEDEQMRPYLWRFFTKTPAKGRITIFDRSWYKRVLTDRLDKITTDKELENAYEDITSFEQQLTDDGTLIIKFFLDISKEEQKKRFEKLESSKNTAWRVTKEDKQHNKEYNQYVEIIDEMLQKTDTKNAPWNIIEATDNKYAIVKILGITIEKISEAIGRVEAPQTKQINEAAVFEFKDKRFKSSVLNGIDLTKSISKEEYKIRLNKAQERLFILQNKLFKKRIPLILAFEGWDAAGKGGAIKRITQKLDPRGYQVIPTSSPNDLEKSHQYLWRFWNNVPKNGHIAIFDRTWYGRVMVERIEGFCTESQWERAYKEINDMERHFTDEGAIVIKFWLHIDKDEQKSRFEERLKIPNKQWKITDEDWRNRERWDDYLIAVDEMLLRTSTTYAPWIVVEANSKYYARIKILETIIDS